MIIMLNDVVFVAVSDFTRFILSNGGYSVCVSWDHVVRSLEKNQRLHTILSRSGIHLVPVFPV